MIEGLKLALKHSTKYEDRVFLQFLIRIEMSKECPDAIYGVEEVM